MHCLASSQRSVTSPRKDTTSFQSTKTDRAVQGSRPTMLAFPSYVYNTCKRIFFFGRRRTLLLNFSISKKEKKCDSHCWHSHCCRTFFAPMSHRTAGIRTFGIRTLVSFALLTPSHCWHSHCWLRTGVVRTSVFRTLVVQACNLIHPNIICSVVPFGDRA